MFSISPSLRENKAASAESAWPPAAQKWESAHPEEGAGGGLRSERGWLCRPGAPSSSWGWFGTHPPTRSDVSVHPFLGHPYPGTSDPAYLKIPDQGCQASGASLWCWPTNCKQAAGCPPSFQSQNESQALAASHFEWGTSIETNGAGEHL